MAFEKIVGKEENNGNQNFLLFTQCFVYAFKDIFCQLKPHTICSLQRLLVCVKLCLMVNIKDVTRRQNVGLTKRTTLANF